MLKGRINVVGCGENAILKGVEQVEVGERKIWKEKFYRGKNNLKLLLGGNKVDTAFQRIQLHS